MYGEVGCRRLHCQSDRWRQSQVREGYLRSKDCGLKAFDKLGEEIRPGFLIAKSLGLIPG